TPRFDPGIIDEVTTNYLDQAITSDRDMPINNDTSPDFVTQTQPASESSQSEPALSQLATNNSQNAPDPPHPNPHTSQPEPNLAPPNLQPATLNHQGLPTPDSRLQTPDSRRATLEAFFRKYAGIDRGFIFGQRTSNFAEAIHFLMEDQSLNPQQAIDAMWRVARQSTWLTGADSIRDCIADYAALPPRLALADPPVSTARPPSAPRYYRPAFHEPSTADTTGAPLPSAPDLATSHASHRTLADESDDLAESDNSSILTSN